MASSVTLISRTTTTIHVDINGLTYPSSSYGAFAFYKDGVWVAQLTNGLTDYTYTGLSAGNVYTLSAKAYYNNVWYDINNSLVMSTTLPVPAEPDSWDEVGGANKNSLYMQWTAISGATSYGYTLTKINSEIIVSQGYTAGTSIQIQNLEYARGYDWTFWGINQYGNGPIGSGQYQTYPRVPSIVLTDQTATSFDYAFDLNCDYSLPDPDIAFRGVIRITGPNGYYTESGVAQDSGTARASNLQTGGTYVVTCWNEFGLYGLGPVKVSASSSFSVTLINPPAIPSNIIGTGDSSTQVFFNWDDTPTALYYHLQLYRSYDSALIIEDASTLSQWGYDNLTAGTLYKFRVAAANGSGESAYSGYSYAITKPNIPSVSNGTSTANSVSATITVSGSYTNIKVFLYKAGVYQTEQIIATSGIATFTGLLADTQYQIIARSTITSSPYTNTSDQSNTLVVTTGGARPANWTSFTMTTGTAMPKYNNKPAPVTATSWNAFTVRINEFRVYKSLANYSFTSAVQGQNATAAQVNQARTAILAMSPPTALPAAVTTGGQITATFLKGLQNSLNSIL